MVNDQTSNDLTRIVGNIYWDPHAPESKLNHEAQYICVSEVDKHKAIERMAMYMGNEIREDLACNKSTTTYLIGRLLNVIDFSVIAEWWIDEYWEEPYDED